MSKKYKEELDKIVMNEDMKKRILSNVLNNNIEVKNTIPVIKKHTKLKRNMQLFAACFTVAVCLSIVKNYPEFFKIENNNLKQSQEIKDNIEKDKVLPNVEESEAYDDNKDNTNNNDGIKNHESVKSDGGNEENKNKGNSMENKSDNKLNNNNKSETGQKEQGLDNSKANSDILSKASPEMQNTNEKAADNTLKEAAANQGETANKENDELGNSPMVSGGYFVKDYKTLEEAEKAVDFKINPVKLLPQGFNMSNINVISNEIIQIDYNNSEKDISFRAGKEVENISGDYNEYKIKNTFKVNDVNINLEGNKAKIINLATWEKDGISYSISSTSGMEEEKMLNMIKSSL